MNIADILKTVKSGLGFVEQLTPLATAIGGPIVGKVLGTVSTVIEIGENLQERIAEGKIVASSEEEAELKALIGKLAEVNDELSKIIANS